MNSRKSLLGARIKELRKRAQLSQDQLAEKVGIDGKYLSRIEVGKRYPSLDTLEHLADALRVEMSDLFDYNHLKSTAATSEGIEILLRGATEQEIALILRLVKAVRQ